MKISDIDKNFEIFKIKVDGKLIEVPSKDVSLFGIKHDKEKGFYRLDQEVAKNTSENVAGLNFHTAGGRVAFQTNSDVIQIYVTWQWLGEMYHMPLTGQAGFSLNELVRGKERHVTTFALDSNAKKGFSSAVNNLDNKKMHSYILYFPLYNQVQDLSIEIRKDAKIKPFNPYKNIKPILYYGSSITQGGCASRSDNCYQGFIAKWNHIDYINLGFSGSAKGEKAMADYIASLDVSCFVMDYDHNAPDEEHLINTHEPMFKAFRKAHPETPVILMTCPTYKHNPKYWGPRRKIIEDTYNHAIAYGDKNVYFCDGKTYFPADIGESATVDCCHPTDLGFYFMAKALYKVMKKIFK